MTKSKSIAKLFSGVYIAVIIVLTITLAAVFIFNKYMKFYEDSKKIGENFLAEQESLIKSRINDVLGYIEYNRSITEQTLKENIKARVNEAHQAALHIYNINKDIKSLTEVKRMITEALRPLRFNRGRGYYFIDDLYDNVILYPPDIKYEGKPAPPEESVKDFIEIARSKGEGFSEYDWFKPGQQEKRSKKITYIKLFAPFDWIIGTGEYLEDVEKDIQERTMERITKIWSGKQEKYRIFAFAIEKDDGAYKFRKMIIGPGDSEEIDHLLSEALAGKRQHRFMQELLRNVNEREVGKLDFSPDNPDVRKKGAKTIFFKLYPQWNWVIGCGFSPDDVKATIIENKRELKREIRIEVALIVAIFVAVLIIAIMISNQYSRKIKKEFNIFSNFFRESAHKNRPLDKKQLKVAEFCELADSANKMIADKKRSEEALMAAKEMAEAASKAKSEFLANMSHEIRTPMNALVGMCDLLEQTRVSEEQQEYIEIINSSANKLITILNDILDLSKIEAGKLELHRTNFNVRDVVEGVSNIAAVEAHRNNIELITFIEPGVPGQLVGDSFRLHQILLNLANNAVKFTQEGEILISVHLEREEKNRVQLAFKIKDTGIGISEKDKQKLFTSFSQVDATATRKYGGTGLGLAISKKLTELMEGEIGVISQEGKGSTFWFTVILEKAKLPAQKERISPPDFNGLKILIADDNETTRSILRKYLESWGCGCHESAAGQEAVERLRLESRNNRPFDIVLIDSRLPQGSSEQWAKAIKNDEQIKDTRLILLSTPHPHQESEAAANPGFAASLNKPISQSQLFNCLARIMGFDHWTAHIKRERMTDKIEIGKLTEKRPLNILVVEDNKFNQKVVLFNLKKYGHHIDLAEDGKAAVEKFKNNRYDLILMDVQMPEMDGYEATRVIRSLEEGEGHTPIIAMTANAMKEDEERSLIAGMDAHLSKPFNSEKFFNMINKIIMKQKELAEGWSGK